MTDIKDLADVQSVITITQATRLKELGFRQISKWGWGVDDDTGGEPYLMFEPDAEGKRPQVSFDWGLEPGAYAAFDYLELVLIMETLDDYYVCGRVLRQTNQQENTWWADTMTNATLCVDEYSYMVYGNTPAEALCNLLIKEIELGKAPINWMYFIPNRLAAIKGMKSFKPGDQFGLPKL